MLSGGAESHEVTEQQKWRLLDNLVVGESHHFDGERTGANGVEEPEEVSLVLQIDQPIVEHSKALVIKKPATREVYFDPAKSSSGYLIVGSLLPVHLHRLLHNRGVHLHDTLYALGQIAQVEDVVALLWRGQKVLRDPLVHVHGGVHYPVSYHLHRLHEVIQEASYYRPTKLDLSSSVKSQGDIFIKILLEIDLFFFACRIYSIVSKEYSVKVMRRNSKWYRFYDDRSDSTFERRRQRNKGNYEPILKILVAFSL